MKRIFALLTCLALCACVRPPKTSTPNNERVLTATEAARLVAQAGERGDDTLDLSAYTRLAREAAAVLASEQERDIKIRDMILNGLKTIDLETMRELSRWQGESLSLDGLTSITPQIARALASRGGSDLSLAGLRSLDVATADELSRISGLTLDLGGLRSLSPEIAEALTGICVENIALGGLTSLDATTAELIFSGWQISIIQLNGLTYIDQETALLISRWEGEGIVLTGLKALSASALFLKDNHRVAHLFLGPE